MEVVKNEAEKKPKGEAGLPAHQQVYDKIRLQILFGDMAPGQSVTIQGLVDSLDVGMTPVREAIRRLIAAGALTFQGNRRISVPVLTECDLSQLIFARKTIESELTRLAATRISLGEVKRLEVIDTELDAAIDAGNVVGYLTGNYQFHRAIYEQSGAPILTEMAERLWLRFGPSLRVVCGRMGTQSLPDRHKDMLAALALKDATGAARAMEQDVQQGMDQLKAVLIGGAEDRFD